MEGGPDAFLKELRNLAAKKNISLQNES